GTAASEQWGEELRPIDFFDVKGDIEALVAPLPLVTRRGERAWLHPGRSAIVSIDGRDAGWIGELHPRLARHFELASAPVVFELDVAACAMLPLPQGRPVSRLPVVRRDLAVLVDEALPAQAIEDALIAANVPYVDTIQPFDVYRGAGLPPGKKSLAILVL